MKDWFDQYLSQGFEGIVHSYNRRVDKRHHRTKKCSCYCLPISQLPTLDNRNDWLGLQSVVMVVRLRRLWNKTTRKV